MTKTLIIFLLLSLSHSAYSQSSYTCDACKGSGKKPIPCTNSNCHNGAIYCSICDFRGIVESTCTSCHGNGIINKSIKETCPDCNGTRYTRVPQETPCSCRGGKRPQRSRGGETIYIDCNRCNGTGMLISYFNAGCRPCGGRGYKTLNVQEQCNTCNGKGTSKSTCTRCDGKGCYVCSTCSGYGSLTGTCDICKGFGRIYAKD